MSSRTFTLEEVCNVFLDAFEIGSKNIPGVTADNAWNHYVNSSRITKLHEIVKEKPQQLDKKPEDLECPECGAKMISRTNRNSGEVFWGCSKYPNCRGTRNSEGLSRYDREKAEQNKQPVTHEPGFSFTKKR